MADYTDYSTVISNAISDFDNIQGALKAKSVVDSNGDALNADTTGVPTSQYASLITDQLFRVGTRTSKDVIAPAGVIADLGTLTLNGTSEFIDGADGARLLKVSATNNTPGYVDGSTAVSIGGINATKLLIPETLSTDGGTGYTYDEKSKLYTFASGTNAVIENVSLRRGSGTISASGATAEHTGAKNEISLATGTANDNINTKVKLALAEGDKETDFAKIDLAAKAEGAHTVTVDITKKFESGYINATDVKFTGNISAAGKYTESLASGTLATGEKTVYLPKGKIDNITAQEGAKVAFTGTDAIVADSGADLSAEDTFATITGSVGGLKITGDITEGWIPAGTSIAGTSIAVESSAIKIKKGKITGGNTNVHLAATPTKVETSDEATDYKISITKDATATEADKTNTPLSVTNGYLTSASLTGVSHTVSVEEKDIYLKAASVKATVGTPTVAFDGTGKSLLQTGTPAAGTEANFYTVSPKVTASVTEGTDSVNGYYEKGAANAFTGTGLAGADAGTFYIKKGSVSFTHDIALGDGNTSSGLTTSRPSGTLGTDYFTISTNGSLTHTEGYITNADVSVGANKTYYMPKAKVKYVTNSTSGKFLEVSSAGYLPTGTITVTEGNLDLAEVKGTLSTGENSILTTTGNNGAYKISITKSMTESGAGYISATEGTLSLDSDYFINKGAVSYKGAIASITKKGISRVDGAKAFNISVTAAAGTVTPTITEGYVKAADISIDKADDLTSDIQIEEATLGVSGTGSISASANANVAVSTTPTKYVVNPVFTAGNITGSVTKAGYVDEETTIGGTVTISDKDKTPLYIKAGTTRTLTPTAHPKTLGASEITGNFGTTVAGDYTVTVNGTDTITGNLESGYYGEDEKTITANSTITGSLKVAHGAVSIKTASATFSITPGSGLTLANTVTEADTEKYYSISANASDLSLTPTITEGYVKTADFTGLSTITGSDKKYIASYKWGADKQSESVAVATTTNPAGVAEGVYYAPAAVQNFGEDAEVAVIHTEATYAEHNILVTLGADAIGTNPKADLERLKKRLAGTLAKTAVGA